MKNTLKFKNDGTLTVMQITDTHCIFKPTSDTVRLIKGALDKVKPDLAVLTGDQIKGYGTAYWFGDTLKRVEMGIDNTCSILEERNIPFAATFGNHDPQARIPLDKQMEIYKRYKSFVETDDDLVYGAGTYALPIMSSDGKEPAFNIYIVDSGSYAPEGGYASVEKEKIEWYKKTRDKFLEKYGHYIPSFMFQHIPVHEMYDILEKVDKKTPGAVRAFRTHKNEYYILPKEIADKGGVLLEPPSISDTNTGQFDAVSEKGDVIGFFFGHDHKNTFITKHRGVDIGYSPSCGFKEYGNDVERGVRVYVLNEKEPEKYSTYVLTYRELFGKKTLNPLRTKFYNLVPTSVAAGVSLCSKLLVGLAVIITAIVLLCKYL
ncbi:MAG: metallophosphoesterase family protein [Clostridiales bacterium]|nr:metallophosphoesterase family protein [Clostridiales bacterium]